MKKFAYFIDHTRTIKILAIVTLTFALIFCNIPISAIAATQESEYIETTDQVTFDYLSVYVVNKEDLVVEVDSSVSFFKKYEAKKQKEKYDKCIEMHPEIINKLKDSVNSNNLICAISYTDAPLQIVDGHCERIKKEKNILGLKASALSQGAVEPSPRHNFSLYTVIYRAGNNDPYFYTAETIGHWDTGISNILNGEKYPAAENDYAFQSCPTVTSTDSFFSTYNYSTSGSTEGQFGTNYFRAFCGDGWVGYEVVDDPFGLAQLEEFYLYQTFSAISTSSTKKIISTYVHTWKEIDFDFSMSGSVGVEGGRPSLIGFEFAIDPNIEEDCWPCSNSVSYNW